MLFILFLKVSMKYTMYVTSYIVRKYETYLYEHSKQLEKTSLLVCFAATANEFYDYRKCTYIVFILQCQKVQNNVK